MMLVFSDLDGTLLDPETYSFEAARPALKRLKDARIPLVLTTSKTRAEVEVWRQRLANADPFIVENGGAIFLPRGYFPSSPTGAVVRDEYDAIEIGDHREVLLAILQDISRESRCRVRGFHQMTPQQVSRRCYLPLEEAMLAKQREYDEAFEILDEEAAPRLLEAIERRGKRWTCGGRFYHILGKSDKAAAVKRLRALYEMVHGEVVTVGLGDAWNDAPFLNAVDIAVLIRSPFAARLLAAVPHGRLTEQPGPAGWNQALLQMIPQ